jgi:hypothetical protein
VIGKAGGKSIGIFVADPGRVAQGLFPILFKAIQRQSVEIRGKGIRQVRSFLEIANQVCKPLRALAIEVGNDAVGQRIFVDFDGAYATQK